MAGGLAEVNSSVDVRRLVHLDATLAAAFAGDALTADDLIRATGGTRATVLAVADELVHRGWLHELPRATAGARGGRPARRFALDAARSTVVGVDAGAHRMLAIAADLRGVELARATIDVSVDASLEERRDALAAVVADARAGLPEVGAMCVGVPAPVAADGRSPAGDSDFWARMNVGGTRIDALAPVVEIENDANLAATAEGALGSGVGVDSYAALLVGERFGAGLVVDGRGLRGHGGMAGELGFLDYVDGVGSSDGLGLVASTLAAEAVAAGSAPLLRGRPALDGAAILAAAAAGDAVALAIVDALGERLARIAMVLADAVGVRLVIVSGDVPEHAERVLDTAERSLARIAIGHAPRLALSTLGRDAVALGACRRAIDAVRRSAAGSTSRVSERSR